jgi:predicted NACHT family NTPase
MLDFKDQKAFVIEVTRKADDSEQTITITTMLSDITKQHGTMLCKRLEYWI